MDRDDLGRIVREAWIEWALTQPNPKPQWLVPYAELGEADKEADRLIGEAVVTVVLGYRAAQAERIAALEAALAWYASMPDRGGKARAALGWPEPPEPTMAELLQRRIERALDEQA